MLVASYIALCLGFGDSCSPIQELTVFHSLIGLPANFQDLPVSMHPTLELQMNTRPNFYMGAEDPNCDPPVFMATLVWLRPQLSSSFSP